jgi:hypothetical protein
MDFRKMTYEQFIAFMREAITDFESHVKVNDDYKFARDGETMPLSDWFEQFAMRKGLI